MTSFLMDVEGPNHDAVIKTTLAKMQVLKSQLSNARQMADIAEEEVQKGIRQIRDHLFLSQQSHEADLVWVVGELKATLASWGEGEIPNAITKDRVQHLVSALDERMKEA